MDNYLLLPQRSRLIIIEVGVREARRRRHRPGGGRSRPDSPPSRIFADNSRNPMTTKRSRFSIAIAIFALSLVGLTVHVNAQPGPAITSRYANVNGVKLHYRAAGKGAPVILLHGYAQNSHM